jgi:uncharacterized protein YyaL (SSP411 family)
VIKDEDDHDDEENIADMEDSLSEGQCDNLGESEPTTQSEMASMLKMPDEQREMLNNAIQQNTQLCVQNAELMEAKRKYLRESIRAEATKTKIFYMTQLDQYCGGVKELDNFLHTFQSNFQSHVHFYRKENPTKSIMQQTLSAHGTITVTRYRDRHR